VFYWVFVPAVLSKTTVQKQSGKKVLVVSCV